MVRAAVRAGDWRGVGLAHRTAAHRSPSAKVGLVWTKLASTRDPHLDFHRAGHYGWDQPHRSSVLGNWVLAIEFEGDHVSSPNPQSRIPSPEPRIPGPEPRAPSPEPPPSHSGRLSSTLLDATFEDESGWR